MPFALSALRRFYIVVNKAGLFQQASHLPLRTGSCRLLWTIDVSSLLKKIDFPPFMMPTKSTGKAQASKPTNTASAKTSRKRKMDPNAQKYYAVRAGVSPGVYLTWAECQEQTAGYRGASYKSFLSREDAEAFVAGKKTSVTAEEGERWYAVAVGNAPGIYTDWDTASLAVTGCKKPKYKRFGTRAEAVEFIRTHGNEAAQAALLEEEPPAKKSKKSTSKTALLTDDEPGTQHVYTDGSTLSNGRAGAVAGVGVFFGKGDPRSKHLRTPQGRGADEPEGGAHRRPSCFGECADRTEDTDFL
ncbi:Caulimovirus viroplasmin-domain-containing protein [Xylariaceae sp. FL0662B]|nr:Caulimovirus viroplasmin-domain-containing protein [Xylariaceae sp. FL0662B]